MFDFVSFFVNIQVHLSYNTFPICSFLKSNGITVPIAYSFLNKNGIWAKDGELLPPSFVHLDVQNDHICSFPL